MPLLPLDIQDLFLRDISPLDRVQYSKTNRDAYRAVQSFNMRAFRVEKVLLPYFDMVEINEFRRLQKLTGMLVSGSTALQFFDRTTYPESDLDVYVEFKGCMAIIDFLQRIGYRYEMYKEEFPTLAAALERVKELNRIGVHDAPNADDTWEGYLSNGMLGVVNFARGGKKVQVIVCRECPMSVILGFHSTCVMNIISHSHAYSLFPRATLIERVSVSISRFTADCHQDAARQKYSERGWRIIDFPPATAVLRPQSEFRSTPRCVGDSSCWTIPLSPIQGEDGLDLELKMESVDPVQANSWDLTYGSNDGTLCFEVESAPDLKFSYCCSSLLQFPNTGEAAENYVDEQLPAMIRKKVDRRVDDASERVWSLLERVYSNMPPLTDRVERETPIILPTARTARVLAGVLKNLLGWFGSDPIVDFSFAVGISTPHVWTNVTISLPPGMPDQGLCPMTFSANESLIRVLKTYKIGLKLKGLAGDVKPPHPGRLSRYNSGYRDRGVQTDAWVGIERVDVANEVWPWHAGILEP